MAASAIEIITNKLYWISDKSPPRNQKNSYYFSIDDDLVYQPFCNDFGPLNIGMTYKFCMELEKLMKRSSNNSFKIFHYTTLNPQKRANAAFLMGAFQIIVLKRSAYESWSKFASQPAFLDFRDAGYGGCTYKCTILHCLGGLERAISLNWFNYSRFNLSEYEHYEKVENGDWNWIIPGKFIAFASPSPTETDNDGMRVWTPEDYSKLFRKIGITTVVRLNNTTYEAERFTKNGIKHKNLYFLDGSVPNEDIIKGFLSIAESEKALAVHCKAGLGRTGTLIAIYVMKHYDFPAADFIGWIRLCRPGSVLGPQQQFLVEIESECKKWANEGSPVRSVLQNSNKLEMSPEEHYILMNGDYGQAERLIMAKKSNQSSPNSPDLPGRSPSAISRAMSQTPNSPPKAKLPSVNIFQKKSGRNGTPASGKIQQLRRSQILK